MPSVNDLFYDTITVFNRVQKHGELYWYPRVVHNAHTVINSSKNTAARFGDTSSDNAMVHILYSGGRMKANVSGFTYVLPKAWAALSDDKKKASITFTSGENFDFWMLGSWTSEKEIRDEDYKEGFYNYMNKTYDNVFAISQCTQSYIIPHFELIAK